MAIYRGAGGAGDSNTDATLLEVTEQAVIATTKASDAAASASAASTSETNAATSATASASSAAAATSEAADAEASATAAANSATAAANSETAAANSATAAATAETNAETAETNAETAETNAETAESNANTSATTATTKASEASTSASNAATSASTATTKAGEAATSATNSANSATSAGIAQTAAEAAKDAALAAFDSFDDRYLGQKSSDPTVDNDGDALVAGALYFNTTVDVMKVYEGNIWVAAYASLSGALLATNNLSDLNNAGSARTNLGLGTAATTAATAYATAAQGTKVDGIEASADVTDTANVTAAGAVMDSELTSEASVKALNQGVATTDSPAFAGIDVTGTATMDGLTVEQNVGSKLTFSSTDTAITTNEVIGEIDFYSADASGIGAASRASISAVAADAAGAGDVYIKTSTGGAAVSNRLKIANNGDISFYEDTGTTPKFFWDASAESLGIGTSSPTAPLSVLNATSTATTVQIGSSTLTHNAGIYLRTIGVAGLSWGQGGALAFYGGGAGTTERMRIDSSGNLLVGTTDVDHYATATNQGMSFRADFGGLIASTRSNNYSGVFNRIGTDGSIIDFRKNGTTVGNIGVALSDNLYLSGVDAGLGCGTGAIYPASTTGQPSANDTDLGTTSTRFKDLYLSGTASAGQVGIGTSTPTEQLDVVGSIGISGRIKPTAAAGTTTATAPRICLGYDWDTGFFQDTTNTIGFTTAGSERMRITSAGVVEFKAGITEDAVTLTGTTTTINLATATNFVHDLTGATTYTFSNPATTGNATAFTLKIIQDSTARTITWPTSVDWAGGTAPTLSSASNAVDVFTFFTLDGGTTYYGFTAGQAMA